MIRYAILLLFSFFLIKLVFAQSIINAVKHTYNTDNGLPSNGVKGLQFDEETGFLWIATEAGIARFNGNTFKLFSKENSDLFENERMLYLIRNRENKIYSQDLNGNVISVQLNRLKAERWIKDYSYSFCLASSEALTKKNIEAKTNLKLNFYENQVFTLSDTSFVGIKNRIFYLFENTKVTTLTVPEALMQKIAIFKLNDKIYVFSQKGLLYLYNSLKKKFEIIYLDTALKLLLMNQNTRVFWNYSNKAPIVINQSNAYQLNEKNGKIYFQLVCNQIPTDVFIQNVEYIQSLQTIFIGTNSKGLVVIKNVGIQSKIKSHLKQYERNAYYAQIEVADNIVLTNEGHLIGDLKSAIDLPIQGKFGFTITTTKDSIIWYSKRTTQKDMVRNCLWTYDLKKKITKEFPNIIGGDFSICETNDHRYFIASNYGIGILKGDSVAYLYKMNGGVFSSVYNMVEYNNHLVIASCNGLLRLNLSNYQLDTIYQTNSVCVRSILKYKDFVLFGTYGDGYFIYNGQTIYRMPLDQNGYLRYVHCFVEDENGFCWMSTNRGLFKAKLADLIAGYQNKSQQIYYHYYGKNEGIKNTELNGGCKPCAIKLKNKMLSFPSMDGLVWVDTNADTMNHSYKTVYIDEILIDEKKITLEQFENNPLPHTQKVIEIKLDFPIWNGIENVYFEYKLSSDEKWMKIDEKQNQTIRLTNLTSGQYELQIRKRTGFGENNYFIRIVHFTIDTPWYKHWLFYFGCIAFLFGIVYLLLQWRTAQLRSRQIKLQKTIDEKTAELRTQNEILEKNNVLKTRLISIISHDIVTPLKFLNVTAKKLHENKNKMPDQIQSFTIKEIADTSLQLQLLSTNILNWIKYQNENRRLQKEKINLKDLVSEVLGVVKSLALQKKLLLVNEINEDLEITQFYEPLKILIYNLVTNAINFSERGTINLTAVKNDKSITILIADEGVGFTKEQINNIMADQFIISSTNVDNRKGNGLGYLIIKDLLKYMGGKLTIQSKKLQGSTISIQFSES